MMKSFEGSLHFDIPSAIMGCHHLSVTILLAQHLVYDCVHVSNIHFAVTVMINDQISLHPAQYHGTHEHE